MASENSADPTKRTPFILDFEPDSPQLAQTLRSLEKKKMLDAGQRISPIDSRRALFNDDSNSFVDGPSESQEFQTLPVSSELIPVVGAPTNSGSVVNVSSESAITLSSGTYDTSVDKSPVKTVPNVSLRKSMRRTKYTPVRMDLSDRKSSRSRSVARRSGGRKSSVDMVIETPAKPSGCNIADKEDYLAESNPVLDDSSIFIAETQILPVTTRFSVCTRESSMVLETPAKGSRAYVPTVPVTETPATIMDITNRVDTVAQSNMELTLDGSSVFTVQTQILPENARNKPFTHSRNIQDIAAVPLFTPSSSSVVNTGNTTNDANSGKRRRTLFTPNKLIELNRSNVMETRDQLLGDITKTAESTKSTDKRSPRRSKKRRSDPFPETDYKSNKTENGRGSVVLSTKSRSASARDMLNITPPEVLNTTGDVIETVVVPDKPLRRKLYAPPSLFDNAPTIDPDGADTVNNELPKTNAADIIGTNQPSTKTISSQAKLSPSAEMLQKLLKNKRRTSMDFETPKTTIKPKPFKMKPAAAAIQYLVTTNLQRSQKEMVQKVCRF